MMAVAPATQIAELCGAVGITNPERFTVLGIKTITDLVQVDVVGDLPLLEKRGITYMDMKRLKNAAESMEVSKGPVTVSVPVSAVEGMSPPAEFAEKFASIARGCFCWRIVEQMRPDRKMLEVVLVVTAEFVLVCSLEGSITQVLRCQDVELVAMQEASPCVLAIKAYEKCCEPTLVMSLKPDMRNPVNDTMHPVHALNYIRNRATQDDIQMVRVPTTTHMHVLPCLSGTFTEGEGYMTPQMKFQILQQTKAWPNSGAQTVQSFEFVYTGSDGVSNTLRLGKSSGKDSSGAGKFQWCVDGKLRMADIREVRYEAGELRFRKNDAIMYPSLPEDDAARMQCLKSIAALASRARVRCTGLPKDGRKKKRDEPYTFQDRDGITHKMVQGSKGSIEWWVGAVMHTVTELTHTRGVLQGTPNGPHAHVEAATLPRLQQVATAAGATYTDVPAEKPERCSSVGLQSVASAGSYRHDPYATHDDFDPDRMSPFDGRDTPNAPPSLASSQNPSPVPEEVDMSGLAIMQPGDEAPPAYAPRGFSQRNSQHGGANSPFYNNNTPTPPPPLCTPIATPTAPTPPAAAVAAAACVPGMPPQAGSAPGVVVNFKHGRQGQFPTVVPVAIGEYVVVETMCGLSIGLVVGEAPSLTGAEVLKVLRLALPQEVALWRDLTQKEQTSLPVISDLALRSQTGLQPCRVEFPFDASCLVVHCSRVPTALVLQLSQNFSALLGCRVVINNCRPRQVGEVGDLINEGASPLPVPVRQ